MLMTYINGKFQPQYRKLKKGQMISRGLSSWKSGVLSMFGHVTYRKLVVSWIKNSGKSIFDVKCFFLYLNRIFVFLTKIIIKKKMLLQTAHTYHIKQNISSLKNVLLWCILVLVHEDYLDANPPSRGLLMEMSFMNKNLPKDGPHQIIIGW